MYKFYKDKKENFECNINIEGASLSNATARLILENSEYNLIFNGSIDSKGKCIIPIPKLKILSENIKGNLKLEVIVDDTYFIPYKDVFEIKTDKKLTVEVLENNPITKTKVTAEINKDLMLEEIIVLLNKNNVNLLNIKKDNKFNSIINEIINKYSPSQDKIVELKSKLYTILLADIKK